MAVSLGLSVTLATLVFQALVMLSSASPSHLRGSAKNSTTSARRLESCTFSIKGTPQSYGDLKNFQWSGPCDSSFSTAHEANTWCKDNYNQDAVVLKTTTGETLSVLSCANQEWTIFSEITAIDTPCSWRPLGSVALQSFHDASAVDIEGMSPSDTRYESEAGCQELCQSIAECKGYSWRSGGKITHKHYHKCFLVSQIGGGNAAKDDWFRSGLCLPRALITPTNGTGGCTAHTDTYNEMQVGTCGCNSSVLSQGIAFCLNGHTLTVARSWDTIHCGGATVELDSPADFTWSSGDNITIGSCKQSCDFDIKATPAKYGSEQHFKWHGPCDTNFAVVQEANAWCMKEYTLDILRLKTKTGETLGKLSCSNQDWSIKSSIGGV